MKQPLKALMCVQTMIDALHRAEASYQDLRVTWAPVSHPQDVPGLKEELEKAIEEDHQVVIEALQKAGEI